MKNPVENLLFSNGVVCVCLGCLTVEGERRLYWTRHLCLSYVRLLSELCAACPIKCLAGSVPHNMSCSSMPSPDYQHFMHIPHLHLIFLLPFFLLYSHLLLRMRPQVGSHPSLAGVIWWRSPSIIFQCCLLLITCHLLNVSSLDQQGILLLGRVLAASTEC